MPTETITPDRVVTEQTKNLLHTAWRRHRVLDVMPMVEGDLDSGQIDLVQDFINWLSANPKYAIGLGYLDATLDIYYRSKVS